jgi:uncharacterized protein (TIGR00369 family)
MSVATFIPADPDFEVRVRASFARQGAMKLIGAELTEVAPGYCAIALAPRLDIAQQHGYVHAGIVSTIVDSAGGYAGFTLFPADSSVLTVEFKASFLAPARGERFEARAIVKKAGRTLTTSQADAYAVGDGR